MITVILSFKLNQSYDRWWKARKIWGNIVNDSRNLVLQLQAFLRPGNEKTIKVIGFRQIAWCFALGRSLRELGPTQHLDDYLDKKEIDQLQLYRNKPLAILQLTVKDLSPSLNFVKIHKFHFFNNVDHRCYRGGAIV